MKHKLFTYSTIALLLGLTACTQDYKGLSNDGSEGTPISFSATGIKFPGTVSRATVDGDWEGVQNVAVKLGEEVKIYTVNSSNEDAYKTATLTSNTPFYWQNTNDISVEAWWPFEENQTEMPAVKVKGDQSKVADFYGSDFIYASSGALSYSNPTLQFNHLTVRVTVTLTKGIGVEGLDGATVTLNNLSTVDGNPGSILTYNEAGTYIYDALLAPQTIPEGTTFIAVNLNGGEFEHITASDINLKAGNRYNYSLKLNATGLELVGVIIDKWDDINNEVTDIWQEGYIYDESTNTYTVYNADGLYVWANHVNSGNWSTNCILANDIVLPDATESNWTPVGIDNNSSFKGVFDGNGHAVSELTSNLSYQNNVGFFGCIGDGGMVKNLALNNIDIRGYEYVGSVAGNNDGIITACYSTGYVQGYNSGGVVGVNNNSINACYFNGNVSGIDMPSCGMAGINNGNITACYWNGNSDIGIGRGNYGGAEKIGINGVTWETATASMNPVLEDVNSEWIYVQGEDKNIPPTLQKQ